MSTVATDPGTVDPRTVDRLRRVLAPLGTLEHAERLTGGTFATTYRARLADGTRVVVKTAPTDATRLMTYEHDLVRTEARVYALAAGHPGVRTPALLATDLTRTVLPGDVVVAAHLPGVPWAEADLPPDDARTARLRRELGAVMAHLHAVDGPAFGYLGAVEAAGGPADPPGTRLHGRTWPEAFGRVVGAILADARAWDVTVPADAVRAALAAHHDALAAVTRPVLVHGDLWPGNVFVDPATGALTGVIDAERALWADPLLELVGADPWTLGPPSADVLAGYAGVAPLDTTSDAARTRMLLYRLHTALVLRVEGAPRGYAPEAVAWCRRTAERTWAWAFDELAALR
ncbi:phosphotransferase family protein [Cellulomonas sp. SLBN-39]|uniref:phosphotransferase family protein n=1 Tax=Cellulomonas sp. SLBN-39 TaxID=2768446 RepID=UPI001153DD1A|nr:phosphotransferase [Cellulomonas sp. SLBN-39]TQL01936.1 phosphotransferase family enzyme [Cellulomonas sp. SLBN-39]